MNHLRVLFLLAAASMVGGCFGHGRVGDPLEYVAQPARISDPAEEVKSLILANTNNGCVSEPIFQKKMLLEKFVCSLGVGNSLVRFDQVKSITLEKSGEWFGARVRHSSSVEDFLWTSKSREDMERMIDALTVLSGASSAGFAADKDASKI